MSYAPLNDGSEAMLTREEQAEAVDDMEGALHYQNVPAPQGPSQRAKSSTYPTNSMYARAQETMLKMRDMAKDGMAKAAKTAKQGMASIERSINAPPAWSAAAASSRPGQGGQRTAVGVNPPGFNGDSTVNGALDNDVAIAERLQGAEAAAEMLFEMRAANDGNPTPEEAEMLSELRAVCEQHLNVLARSVERGAGLISESLLMKCIEVAESLVSAIGDGENPGVDASGGGGAGGYAPPGSGAGDTPGGDETAVVDLLGGLDVNASEAPSPAARPGEDGRPATAAEEEAMIAAAIAASLAEGGDEQKPPPTTQQQAPQPATGNLIDI